MNDDRELASALKSIEWIAGLVYGIKLPATMRVRAAGACHAIVQDHHHSIVLLIQNQRFAAAFALARPAFESFLRGEWLAHCATDQEVEDFVSDKDPPKLDSLLQALEKLPAYSHGYLSAVKTMDWAALCSFTHTGGLHVQRWLSESGIEPTYSPEEVLKILKFAHLLSLTSAMAVAQLSADEELALKMFARIRDYTNEA
jgi:hypothetical protein